MQILQTDLHAFSYKLVARIWKKTIQSCIFLRDHFVKYLIIIFPLDDVWIFVGENWCWSLLGRNNYITFSDTAVIVEFFFFAFLLFFSPFFFFGPLNSKKQT